MSKERRRRRAAREAGGPAHPARPAPPARTGRPTTPRASSSARRPKKAGGVLARKRRQENLFLVLGLLAANALLWTQVSGWPARVVALVLTAALWPIIVTVAFDRRSS